MASSGWYQQVGTDIGIDFLAYYWLGKITQRIEVFLEIIMNKS